MTKAASSVQLALVQVLSKDLIFFRSAKEFPSFHGNHDHDHVHNGLIRLPMVSHITPSLALHHFKIYLNIILQLMAIFSQLVPSLQFLRKYLYEFSYLPCVLHNRPSHKFSLCLPYLYSRVKARSSITTMHKHYSNSINKNKGIM